MEKKKFKIPRIVTPNTYIKGKEYLSKKALYDLIEDCFVEEKLDGSLLMIETRDFVLYGEDLRKTHTIKYDNLPNDVIFFDVYDKKDKRFLNEYEKVLFLLEIGATPVPIIGRLKRDKIIKNLKKRNEWYIESYLENLAYNTKSAFKTKFNQKMLGKMKTDYKDLYEEYRKLNKNFVEGIVLKNYETMLFGKVVIPIFEKTIYTLGRYERYPEDNIIVMYDYKKYCKYIRNHVFEPLELKLSKKERKFIYEMYVKKFRTWTSNSFILKE